ncbi:MAG: anion permease, partial [Bacteroidales bacterium]|nr:anion permease [Bacteroidales bacterium]
MAKKFNLKLWVFLPLVVAVTVFLWAVPVSFFGIDSLTVVQQRVISLFVFAALMWIFEIIPNWATSLLVIVIALLTVSNKGIGFFCNPQYGTLVPYARIMSSMADPVVMLFLGGFVLAIMAERYGLDVTLARALLKLFGTNPYVVLLGFLIMISIFSMFMSNTATAAMMLALLTPVLSKLPADDKGKVGLALSIPVAANLGGIGTPIGTPPNATAKGALEQAGIDVSFGEWCAHMIPYVVIMIVMPGSSSACSSPSRPRSWCWRSRRTPRRKTGRRMWCGLPSSVPSFSGQPRNSPASTPISLPGSRWEYLPPRACLARKKS